MNQTDNGTEGAEDIQKPIFLPLVNNWEERGLMRLTIVQREIICDPMNGYSMWWCCEEQKRHIRMNREERASEANKKHQFQSSDDQNRPTIRDSSRSPDRWWKKDTVIRKFGQVESLVRSIRRWHHREIMIWTPSAYLKLISGEDMKWSDRREEAIIG